MHLENAHTVNIYFASVFSTIALQVLTVWLDHTQFTYKTRHSGNEQYILKYIFAVYVDMY